MQYTLLQGSDLEVSRVALGTWLFGGRRWGKVDARENVETIESAIDAGISLFDTADAYGVGQAETLLGSALKGRRHGVVIATKVGVVWHDDGSRYIDLSPSHIALASRASLKRLQTDYIDLYQLHEMDPETPIAETGQALQELLRAGVIRHVGVSNFDVETLAALRAIVPVLSVQSEYSLIKREIERDILPYCEAHAVSLLTYSPLCRGLLSGKFTTTTVFPESDNRFYEEEFQGDRFAANLDRVARLAGLAQQFGCSPAALAIRWVLDTPSVSAVICGARTPAQLRANLEALDCHVPAGAATTISSVFD